MENRYIEGLYVNAPREKAPAFVKGSISIQKDRFMKWLSGENPNEKGYINIDLLEKKDGSGWYAKINDFQVRKDFMTQNQGSNMSSSSGTEDASEVW